jgi:pyruvate, water dikinase
VSEPVNVIHGVADPGSSYTSTNLAEAMPGIATPLGWSIWGPAADHATRAPWHALGALARRELAPSADPAQREVNVFYGRIATRMNFFCEVGDRLPGSNGVDLAQAAFGYVPPNFVSHPTKRRYPAVMAKTPLAFVRARPLVARARRDTAAWWAQEIRRTSHLHRAGAVAQLMDARARFGRNLDIAAIVIVCGIQPMFMRVMKLAVAAGLDPTELMRGQGSHEETAMIDDLWRVSRDRLSLATFLARHGAYGPNVGEISQRSWREDPAPLTAVIQGYRAKRDDADPVAAAAQRARDRVRAERSLIAGLPAAQRPRARLVLELASRYLPLRAVAKVAFVQSLDVARSAARRAGALLSADGVLADPEDVFYLTAQELVAPLPSDVRSVVDERRSLRARYAALELPTAWEGVPEPRPIATGNERAATDTLSGTGVSAGVVEGTVRVVTDPAETEMEDGEILVAHTTDPAWASVMFLARALVVDIGGQLSHAAVVAREIGVPCVMGTHVGTRVLRSGDRCRVDGTAGTVEILERGGA